MAVGWSAPGWMPGTLEGTTASVIPSEWLETSVSCSGGEDMREGARQQTPAPGRPWFLVCQSGTRPSNSWVDPGRLGCADGAASFHWGPLANRSPCARAAAAAHRHILQAAQHHVVLVADDDELAPPVPLVPDPQDRTERGRSRVDLEADGIIARPRDAKVAQEDLRRTPVFWDGPKGLERASKCLAGRPTLNPLPTCFIFVALPIRSQ